MICESVEDWILKRGGKGGKANLSKVSHVDNGLCPTSEWTEIATDNGDERLAVIFNNDVNGESK